MFLRYLYLPFILENLFFAKNAVSMPQFCSKIVTISVIHLKERDVCFMFVELRLTKFIIPHYKVDVFNGKMGRVRAKTLGKYTKMTWCLFSQIWQGFENFKFYFSLIFSRYSDKTILSV